jgi:hypothetical protein
VGDAGANDLLMDYGSDHPRIRIGFGQTLNGVPGPTAFVVEQEPARLFISLGDGDDVLFYNSSIAVEIIFDFGRGDDFFDLGVAAFTRVAIYAGDGDDHVHIEDSYSIIELVAHLGPGADSFEVASSSVTGAFAVYAGAGADTVRLRYALFESRAFVSGGSGVDVCLVIDSDFSEKPKIYGFENRIRSRPWIRPARSRFP